MVVPKVWPGETVICIANGPSLTVDDVDYCRGMGRVICVNDTYRLAPWADCLYGCDAKWWKWQFRFHKDRIEAFEGLRYAMKSKTSPNNWPLVEVLKNTGPTGLELDPGGLRTGRNSGSQAINLAVHLGAAKIVLLGYDMSLGQGGKSHWFGEHPDRAKPPLTVFRRLFPTIAKPLKEAGIEVLNCSRRSALTCFPKVPLESALPKQVAA
jgi:hypothetical protein